MSDKHYVVTSIKFKNNHEPYFLIEGVYQSLDNARLTAYSYAKQAFQKYTTNFIDANIETFNKNDSIMDLTLLINDCYGSYLFVNSQKEIDEANTIFMKKNGVILNNQYLEVIKEDSNIIIKKIPNCIASPKTIFNLNIKDETGENVETYSGTTTEKNETVTFEKLVISITPVFIQK
jgi:hypothetical protein